MTFEEFVKSFGGKLKEKDIKTLKSVFDNEEPLVLENMISFKKVIEESNISIERYIKAVKYVTFVSMGYSNAEAWKMTFPEKLSNIKEENIDQYASAYNRTKLVLEIKKILMIPTYIMYHNLLHEAISTQAELMRNARSELVRHQSAKALMDYLRPPEENQLNVNVNVESKSVIDTIEKKLNELSSIQHKMIEDGKATPKEIVEMNIIDAEIIKKEE